MRISNLQLVIGDFKQLFAVFEPLECHSLLEPLDPLIGTTVSEAFRDNEEAQKVAGTNGTVVVLQARNVTYWRTEDFSKLLFV